jgi:hypothetical protein
MFFLRNQSTSATGDCAFFVKCNTDPLSRQPQSQPQRSLKNTSDQQDRKTALTEIPKSAKIKTDHPAGFSKGAIYKLRLWLLFKQFQAEILFAVLKPLKFRF